MVDENCAVHGFFDCVVCQMNEMVERRDKQIENLSMVLRIVWGRAIPRHQKLITDVLEKYGNPGSVTREDSEEDSNGN